ncbi:MAG: polysulfide reductase NrfD, partial [Ignavibacteriaceae bacterium]|nr:polysulfide reductase NrfD [Ignavibacteriaceae bacterium]
MLELALKGTKKYWGWIFFLSAIILVGVYFYSRQFGYGLGITGLSRDVTWGFYIAQLTFLVGVAASGVMVVLPYYLHDYKAFGKLTILGEFLAIAAIVMCILFVAVDVGQPLRMINLILYPSPSSILFWDTVVLSGYLLLNVIISHTVLEAERKSIAPPKWIKPIIILSIPWAISIHTVTAFLYSGLAARPFWMTAVLAPRFLASAFSSGPALLLIMVFIIKKITKFDPGKEAVRKLGLIITYA